MLFFLGHQKCQYPSQEYPIIQNENSKMELHVDEKTTFFSNKKSDEQSSSSECTTSLIKVTNTSILCHCGDLAAEFAETTGPNKGKTIYVCPKDVHMLSEKEPDKTTCSFRMTSQRFVTKTSSDKKNVS